MKNKCLFEFLEEEGYGTAKIKKITDAYVHKKTHTLKGYEYRSLCEWILYYATGETNEANHNQN